MSIMMTMQMTDVFDVATMNGASSASITEGVEYIRKLGNTPTREAQSRMGDLALIGYIYERGWLT